MQENNDLIRYSVLVVVQQSIFSPWEYQPSSDSWFVNKDNFVLRLTSNHNARLKQKIPDSGNDHGLTWIKAAPSINCYV